MTPDEAPAQGFAEYRDRLERAEHHLMALAQAAKELLDDMDKHNCWPPGQQPAQDHVLYYHLRCLIKAAEYTSIPCPECIGCYRNHREDPRGTCACTTCHGKGSIVNADRETNMIERISPFWFVYSPGSGPKTLRRHSTLADAQHEANKFIKEGGVVAYVMQPVGVYFRPEPVWVLIDNP